MTNKKSRRILIGVVSLLIMVCIFEGFVIYKYKHNRFETIVDGDINSFMSQFENHLKANQNQSRHMLDHFFNDDFFSSKKAPFSEMERLRKQMNEMMEKEMQAPFNDSWSSWFKDRFLGNQSDMDMRMTQKKDEYIITLTIPHLKDNRLNVNIDDSGIAIDGEYSQTAEKKDAHGNLIKKEEIHRSISRKFPIPPDADYQHARVNKKSDQIVITLPKSEQRTG